MEQTVVVVPAMVKPMRMRNTDSSPSRMYLVNNPKYASAGSKRWRDVHTDMYIYILLYHCSAMSKQKLPISSCVCPMTKCSWLPVLKYPAEIKEDRKWPRRPFLTSWCSAGCLVMFALGTQCCTHCTLKKQNSSPWGCCLRTLSGVGAKGGKLFGSAWMPGPDSGQWSRLPKLIPQFGQSQSHRYIYNGRGSGQNRVHKLGAQCSPTL